MSVTVLHVIQQHTLGGASRSLVALAGHATRDLGSRHRVVSLTEPHARAVEDARTRGIDVIAAPDGRALAAAIDAADIVQVHYWNTPELVSFIRTAGEPMRTVIWCDIAGDSAPHVVTPSLVGWADAFVACCRYTAALPLFAATREDGPLACETIIGTTDFDRVADVRPVPHGGFTVGYIGTVDFTKMEPRYVAMHAAIDVPGLKCLVYGSGDGFRVLAAQAARLHAADRFEFGGYAHDIAGVIARLDVFGYPLVKDCFAATELVLQEVMYAGVPPVIFRRGGAQHMVDHGRTGLVVDTEADYIHAIEYLHAHPDRRRRMGAAAAADARRRFDPARAARELRDVYDRVLARPKRRHLWSGPARTGAALFVDTLGGLHPEFAASLLATTADAALEAEDVIRRSSETLMSPAAGGILHYRRRYPDDPHLRLWAGLVLLHSGRAALAAADFHAARAQGLGHWRASWYLAQAAIAAGSRELARDALGTVLEAAPAFAPARELLRDEGRRPTPRIADADV